MWISSSNVFVQCPSLLLPKYYYPEVFVDDKRSKYEVTVTLSGGWMTQNVQTQPEIVSNTKVLQQPPPDLEKHHHIVVGRSLNQILCFVEWMKSTHSPIRCCCLTEYICAYYVESSRITIIVGIPSLRAFLFTLKPPPSAVVVYLSLLLILYKPSVTSPIHRVQWQWGTVCDCDPHKTKPSLSSRLW